MSIHVKGWRTDLKRWERLLMASNDADRYYVARFYGKWVVQDLLYLSPPRIVSGPHDTREQAQEHADRLNTPRPTPQRTQQDALFKTQEA